jgi:hypothetical protein
MFIENIRDFAVNSLQNFPFTMFVSFLLLGFVFFQPTWSLISAGMLIVYLFVAIIQKAGAFLPPDIAAFLSSPVDDISPCYPYSTSSKSFNFPSEWMTQTAFVFIFIIYNSAVIARKQGNKALFEAYQRRLSRTQLSILVSSLLLVSFAIFRITTGCDTIVSVLVGTGIGAGIAVAYWHILDICNTQLHSDILGITRNMAPTKKNDEDVAVACTL